MANASIIAKKAIRYSGIPFGYGQVGDASIDELNDIIYNHADHLGSSNVKTDSSGNIAKRMEYMPFGSKRLEVGTYNNIKQRFTGQHEDEESGLYYYQQRYYNPVLSRFITADPLYLEEMDKRGMDSQELNLYAYVRNNPLKYTDDTGEIPILAPALGFLAAKGIALATSYVGTQIASKTTAVSTGQNNGFAEGNKAFDSVMKVNAPQVLGASAVLGGAVLAPVVLTNPEKAMGSAMSFFEGFMDGFTKANVAAFDGRYAPDSFLGQAGSLLFGEAGKMLGNEASHLYGEATLGPTETSTPVTDHSMSSINSDINLNKP